MSLSAETREEIAGLLARNPVVLFMKGNRVQPQCGFSAKTVAALDMLVPDYVTVDVLQDAEIREGIKLYGNWPTIPQLYVNGELIGGCDIVQEMFASGELADALGIQAPDAGEPSITIDPAAAEIMANAVRSNPGVAIHLKIDAGFGHSLSLAPARSGNITVKSGDVALQMDPWSAARAEGLRIGVRDSLQGQGFAFSNPNAPPPVQSITVAELSKRLAGANPPHLFDVRGDDERDVALIGAARPWNEAAVELIESLPKDAAIVFHCHKGGRSLAVAERYRRRGYTNLFNLEGGIDAWSREIDPGVSRY